MARPKPPTPVTIVPTETPQLHVMPGGKVRLDPACVASFATWLLSYTEVYEAMLERPKEERGAGPKFRREGEDRYARAAISVLHNIIERLTEQRDLELMDNAREAVIQTFDKLNARHPSNRKHGPRDVPPKDGG